MADTFTTNLNLTKPEPGAAEDTWGISLNSDLDTLDAIFSSSGTQINLNPNQVNFADNKKAIFGTGSDLQIYHDGSNSYIKENGTGALNIAGQGNINFTNSAGSETYAQFTADSSVKLYHDNSIKLTTTSSGIDVTGTVTADGILKDTASSFNYISGGNASNAGANILLYGQSHASAANTTVFRASGSETARILSDGKLLVGKTAASIATAGVELRPNGQLFATQSANYPLLLNRTTSDGDIIQLRKDNTTIGNIGSFSAAGNSYLTIGSGDTGLLVNSISDALQPWNISTNAGRDAAIDLGATSGRFKDLHLSGTAYVGTSVGIGTTSPSEDLHISGDTSVALIEGTNNATSGLVAGVKVKAQFYRRAGFSILDESDNEDFFIGRPYASTNQFVITNDGTERLRIDTSGNVGIGTSSPNYPLTVHSTGDGIKFEISDLVDANFRIQVSGNDIKTGPSTASDYIFQTGNTERMRLDSSGRLGIGTTSPESILHIEGSGVASLRFDNIGPSSNSALRISRDDTSISSGNPLGYLEFGGKDTTSNADTAHAYIAGVASGTHSAGSNPTDLTFGTTPSGSSTISERVRIDSSGNFGIGTTSPNASLSISKQTTALSGTGNTYGLHLYPTSSGAVYVDALTGSTSNTDLKLRSYNNGTYNQLIGSSSGGTVTTFQTGGSERMRITSDGSVGIGTSSPSEKLHVKDTNGSIAIDANGASNTASIKFINDNERSRISSNYDTGGGGRLTFHTDTTGGSLLERMRIDNSGNLGIGTTSPSAPLHVVGNSYVQSGTLYTDAITAYSGSSVNINAGSSHFNVTVNGSERARIDSSGRLLLNTTSVDGMMRIDNAGQTTQTLLSLKDSGGTGTHTQIQFENTNGVVGNINTSGTSTAYNTSSDARLKDVTGEARGLDVINALNPVSYNWKADGKADEGLIAQEVQEIVPNAVSQNAEEYYQMDYSKLVVHLVKGMKEQQEQIEALQSEINLLKGE